jgi:hypothetical protein
VTLNIRQRRQSVFENFLWICIYFLNTVFGSAQYARLLKRNASLHSNTDLYMKNLTWEVKKRFEQLKYGTCSSILTAFNFLTAPSLKIKAYTFPLPVTTNRWPTDLFQLQYKHASVPGLESRLRLYVILLCSIKGFYFHVIVTSREVWIDNWIYWKIRVTITIPRISNISRSNEETHINAIYTLTIHLK